ncbi:MAG: CHAT domain-containing protein [Deltaproteobacteria bacterium]
MRVAAGTLALVLLSCGGVDIPRPTIPEAELEGLRTGTLVAFTPEDDLLPSVSSDGRYVLFASEQNGNLDVWVRDFGRHSTYPITKESSADDFDPKISPDGRRMAFVTRRLDAKGDIFISDSNDESDLERITDERTHDRQPAWAPNGETIYFTAALGIAREHIAKVDIDSKKVDRVSPGPGFDPAVSPDGRYLVYTQPERHPRLVALELASGSTVALTIGEAPEGFAAFVPPSALEEGVKAGLLYVRFPDDDNGDGILDAADHGSIWRIDVDLPALFAGGSDAVSRPRPLTDGSDDELFPNAGDGWLYVTRGSVQQDIVRFPIDGMFPPYEDPAQYLALAKTVEDPRTRWFVYRLAEARTDDTLLGAQIALNIANLHLAASRDDLARPAFERVFVYTRRATADTPRAQLAGLARTELAAIEHRRRVAAGDDLTNVIERTEKTLLKIRADCAWSERVVARVNLELAELLVARGHRVLAIEAFDRVIAEHPEQTYSAARAALRRIELLQIAHDPPAIGEAYRRVLEQWPDQVEIVNEASRRIVAAHLEDLVVGDDWKDQVDALRRIIPRFGASPVRREARWQLARLLEEHGALDSAALEYRQIVAAAKKDRLSGARGMVRLHTINERRGARDEASRGWRELRSRFSDLPGYGALAREAITRVDLERAQAEEEDDNLTAALAAYKNVIDNDLTQVKAHRRYLALSAQVGRIDEALAEAKARAEASAGTPIARYAYGLALTWADPPKLDDAWDEIAEAIRLNPQLPNAYVTRGWIRERRERSPSTIKVIIREVTQRIGQMVGGFLDVEIGQQGELELALEDYKTALRLNPESTAPEAEAEILLNLGNAHYLLAETTQDVANMRLAFDRYVEMWRLGYAFYEPIVEAIFWERFGRSAIWADEPALSAMATRRAIQFAKKHDLDSRLAQLYGNLALAYANAGEDAYAEAALAEFDSALTKRKIEERVIIAVRNRARSRLATIEARSTESLDEVLRALRKSRHLLAKEKSTGRQTPDLWRGAIANYTSAQYGFRAEGELDLNLALAEITHQAHGETSRVRALREARLDVTSHILETIPTKLMIDTEPVALTQARERIGLVASRARALLERGDPEAITAYDAALAEVDRWYEDGRLALDRPALAVDRGRVLAARVEAKLRLGLPIADEAAGLEAARTKILEDLSGTASATTGALLLTSELLETLPSALTSTGALAQTSSIAMHAPLLGRAFLDARAVRARLSHALGLVQVDAVHRGLRGAADLDGALASLDAASREGMRAAHERFDLAAREAAGAGPGLGGTVVVAALTALARTARAQPDQRVMSAAFAAEAQAIAKRIGRPDLEAGVLLTDAWTRTATHARTIDTQLRARGPHVYLNARDAYERLLERVVGLAVAQSKTNAAFAAVDRMLLVHTASGVGVQLSNATSSSDRAASTRYRRFLDRLTQLRGELASTDLTTSVDDHAALLSRINDTMEALAEFEELAVADYSEAGYLRTFRLPQDPDFVAADLTPRQIVIAPFSLEGRVHLALVDGSTTAPQLAITPTDVAFEDAKAALAALRVGLQSGYADSASVEVLQAALVTPIAARLKNKRHVVFASALLGGPIPGVVLPKAALTHVSAPSALAQAALAQVVGVEGQIVVATDPGAPLVDGRVLDPRQTAAFRATKNKEDLQLGAQRSLDERSAVERLAARAVDAVVVDAPVILEPNAPERAALSVGTATSADGDYGTPIADRFSEEVPLTELDLPSRVLVLGRVTERDLGGAAYPADALLSLDLTLAMNGHATTLIVPERVPRPVARRVVQRFLDRAKTQSYAYALAATLREERASAPQVDLIALVGAPGLDAQGQRAYAKRNVTKARRYAIDRLKNKRYEEVVPALERWIRLQFSARAPKYVKSAYLALVGVLSETLEEHARAADAMEQLVEFMASKKGGKKERRQVADARVDLAYLYSRAHDYVKAEQTFAGAIEELEALGQRDGVARAWFKLARHYKEKLDFEAAAKWMEKSVDLYEDLGQYAPGAKRTAEANLALEQAGHIYLTSLSDPVRAERAYERAIRFAKDEEARIDGLIDLARVARRRGDFTRATELAEAARKAAADKKLPTRELSGVIESANVAWYRGDYARGRTKCEESLALASKLYGIVRDASAKKKVEGKVPSKREVQRLEIFARSVCGLVAMSQRDYAGAIDYLSTARRIADSTNNRREVATQFNNLGNVYLEQGLPDDAADAFRKALSIDTKLSDKYALAYDLRNLGRALTQQRDFDEAAIALRRGLEYAKEARDTNNELRARFALALLAEARGDEGAAQAAYAAALPLAERLDVRDITWQIHRAQGQAAEKAGDLERAEASYRSAVAVAGTLTGRASVGEVGPNRFETFDDLMRLYLDQDRDREAFDVAVRRRQLEQLALLADARVPLGGAEVLALLSTMQTTTSATVASEALTALRKSAPRVADVFEPIDVDAVAAQLPGDAAILMYTVTRQGLATFALTKAGLVASQVKESGLVERVQRYAQLLADRADLSTEHAFLATAMFSGVREALKDKRRAAFVLDGPLAYVAVAALPYEQDVAVVDRFVPSRALHVRGALRGLTNPMPAFGSLPIRALGASSLPPGSARRPLPFARRELDVIQEEFPSAAVTKGDGVTRSMLASTLASSEGVFHFAGHSVLADNRRGVLDPLGGQLLTSDGPVSVLEVLRQRTASKLVVLSACFSMLAPFTDSEHLGGEELVSFVRALHLAGAEHVLATSSFVDDLSASVLMKRFYRAAKGADAPTALAEAQRAVRVHHPHPAWWATFAVVDR